MGTSTVSGPFRSANGFQQLDENGEWAPVTGAITSVNAGAGVSVNSPTGDVIVTNTGVTSVVAGSGVSVSQSTGAVTISATGGGVTSITAGSNISVSSSTGNVTISASGGGPAVTVYLNQASAYSNSLTNPTPAYGNYIEIPKTLQVGQIIRFLALDWGMGSLVWKIYLPQPVGGTGAAPTSTGAPSGTVLSIWGASLITSSPSYTYPSPPGVYQVNALSSSGPGVNPIYFYGSLSTPGFIDIMRGNDINFGPGFVVASFSPITPLYRDQVETTGNNRAPNPLIFPANYS